MGVGMLCPELITLLSQLSPGSVPAEAQHQWLPCPPSLPVSRFPSLGCKNFFLPITAEEVGGSLVPMRLSHLARPVALRVSHVCFLESRAETQDL